MNYPELNSSIKYIRQDYETKKIVSGEGIVKGIFLDPNNRVLVSVKDEENKYNIDLAAVNPTKEFTKLYKEKLKEITEISKEGNDKAQATVDEYNKLVDKIYDDLLGKPLEG